LVEAKALNGNMTAPLRQSVTSPSGAILLLLTDNFLKSEQCMNGALEALKHWADNGQLVPIVADGRQSKSDGTGWETVPTQFDRVSNIIHYMNHWQDKYLTMRKDIRSHEDDANLEAKIEITKNIAGEVGEFLRYLRNLRWYSLDDFKASNYFAFRQFTDDVPPQAPAEAPQAKAPATDSQEPRQRTLAEIIQDSGDELMAENTDIGQPKKKKAPEDAPVVDLNDIPGISLLEDLDLDAEAEQSGKNPNGEKQDGAEFSSILSEVLGEDDGEEFKFIGEDPDHPDDFDLESLFEEDEGAKTTASEPDYVDENEVSLELISDEDEGLVLRADGNGHSTPEEVLEHAVLLFDDGKMAEGLDFLRKTVMLNASDDIMRYYYAYALARYGNDFAGAKDQLEVILASDHEHTDALFLLGELSESLGDYEEAKHNFETVAALQPDFPEVYYRLGMLTLQHFEGQENLALEFFKKSVEFSPKHADGHYILATLYNEFTGDPVNAIKHFNLALRFAPNHSYANYDLARLHLQHGDQELAAEHYKSAVKVNPELKSAENDAAFLTPTPKYEVEIIPTETTENQAVTETLEELVENAAAAEDITEALPEASDQEEIEEIVSNIAAAEKLVEAPIAETSPEEIAAAVENAVGELSAKMPILEEHQAVEAAEIEDFAEQKTEPLVEPKAITEQGNKNFTSKLEQILDAEDDTEEDEFVLPLSNEKTAVETKTVLITGATSGIGRATAELFAKNGYRVIATGRRAERLDELAHFFKEKYQADVLTLPFDVRNLEAVQAAIENLPTEWQEVDILINNAGLSRGLDPIHEGKIEDWETMIDTNIKGLLYLTRAIAPHMVKRRSGHIINVASSAGKEVYPGGNVYCATKFAVDALTKAMRIDLFTHNVRVSQVAPGHVEETEFASVRFDGDTERAAKVYENFQPLRASDVADVIYFIATRPAHVNVQDVLLFGTQQAGSTFIDRSGRA